MPLDKVIKEYNKTFKSKTGTSKGYMAIEMKLGADDEDEEEPAMLNT